MLRKIGISVLCLSGLISTNAFSTTQYYVYQAPFTKEYILPPNEPISISNFMYWKLEAKCLVVSEAQDNPVSLKVLRKSGSLNGIPLDKGTSMDITVQSGDALYITAASGATVELINHGDVKLKAICELVTNK